MKNTKSHNRSIILLTLLVGLISQIMPWASSLYLFKPNWLLLILAYWILALPHRVGIGTAFIIGIILDLFLGTVLGVHAFIFSLIAYLILFRFQLLRNFAFWQQSFIIFGLSVLYHVLLFLFELAIYQSITMSPTFFISSAIDALLWTWIFLLLRLIRRRFAIS